ncbi:SGNH/GDSL hydrolase family protein [Ramlibacter tataouinensis]|uniref:Esterase (Lipase)-like protein n=1 Tax=Ramlibacter tataouinensis (strain ATCC BAA-407 / DSM 14655 / LMG 21543 / TTB310) TaxID=365046 RepID=F5Y610_RAMTT|nr:GDSL-type esterase/lipase family protein [Ramlibacter tataouinensis]AEG91514.1 esterase (lipase)-like protein [Ramlibacter tataouinensis TTB310]
MDAWTAAACGALSAALTGVVLLQAARLQRAIQLAERHRALPLFQRRRPGAPLRILLLGDSTGVGVGCDPASHSIGARLARDWPDAEIVNACSSGARVRDTLARVARESPQWRRFDLVLLQVGGNDVLRFARLDALRRDLQELLARLAGIADHVVWAGLANVGRAPLFIPPFSWLLSGQARRCCRLFAECARQADVAFIDFYREPSEDPFSADAPRYYAHDGLHPSGEAYAYCYRAMRPVIARALA